MVDDQQTPEEAAVQAGDGSVGQFVLGWLGAILGDRDWALAMQYATPELRLARAQAWILNTVEPEGSFDRDAAAEALANIDQSHPLWEHFAEAELRGFDEAWGEVRDHLAVGSRPRPLDPTHEVVLVVDYRTVSSPEAAHGDYVAKLVDSKMEVQGFPFVVRHDAEGVRLASHNGPDHMPVPGWPPQL